MKAHSTPATHRVVSKEEWLKARTAHLAQEKELSRRRDELARERRELPWTVVEKEYVFDGPRGKVTLADLFGGHSQLVVYHFMFAPEAEQGCQSCSMVGDGMDGTIPHLADRDIALAAVSRAPYPKIEAFKRRMGWRFDWVSSHGTDFNRDFHVTFTADEKARGAVLYNYTTTDMSQYPTEEAQGLSVFVRDPEGRLYHTYSSYARGCEPLIAAYHYLDLVPNGRGEEGLPYPMAWVRHHDRYGAAAEKP